MQANTVFEGATLNSITLGFKNDSLELSFLENFAKASHQAIRHGIILSLFFWGIALLSLWLAETPYLREIVMGFFVIAAPLYFIMWGLTLSEKLWRFYQPTLILKIAVIGFVAFYLATNYLQDAIMVTASLMFTSLFAFLIYPLNFTAACASSMIVMFMGSTFLALVRPFSNQELMYISLCAGLGWVGLAYAGYFRHLNQRREFLLRQKVASANAGSKTKGYLDNLTQLFNQRYLIETVKELLSPPISSTFAVAMIDIDHLSYVNNAKGRETGDSVLAEFADIIRDSVRQSDIPIRFGGEEFVILMKDIALEDAHIVVERMRVKTANHRFTGVGEPVTFSSGIALMNQNDLIDDTLSKAEDKLYQAKDSGRNRTVM